MKVGRVFPTPLKEEMSLAEELKGIIGKRRRYLLLRILDVDKNTALSIANTPKATYNTWVKSKDGRETNFLRVHRQIGNFSINYRQEALQLLRKGNQLSAILLEKKLLTKIADELEKGEYDLIKTNLARAVYEKMLSSIDYQPQVLGLSWTQRLQQIFTNQPQIEEGITEEVVTEAEEIVDVPKS